MPTSYPPLLYSSVFCALMGAYSFGYHLGVLNTSLKTLAQQFDLEEDTLAPIATCSLLLGAAVGSVLAGHLADKLGPKRASILNNVPLIVGSLVCAGSCNVATLCIGRLMAGLGSGAASLFVPRYIAEVSPPEVRGALGTLTQVFINVGILVSYIAGLPYEFGVSTVVIFGHALAWWRCMMVLALLPSIIQVIMSTSVPESPVWLGWTGQVEVAQDTTAQLHGRPLLSSDNNEDDNRRSLLAEEEGNGAHMSRGDVTEGWFGLFKRRYRWILAITTALPILQQLSGINTVIFYSSQVFRTAGLKSPIMGTLLVGVVNLTFTFVSSILMDRAGRKTLLLLSHGGMAASLIAMIAAMNVQASQTVYSIVTFIAILTYIMFFALGVGPIPWLYIGEVMPNEIKGKAGALCTSLNWTTTLLVGLSFPSMLWKIGLTGSYTVYAVFNVLAVLFFSHWLVETRNQSLPQIRQKLLLKDKVGA